MVTMTELVKEEDESFCVVTKEKRASGEGERSY